MREIKEIKRKTDKGKQSQKDAEDERIKGDKLFQASLKKNKDEDGDSWESVEEDAPAIKLGELLENMKINDDDESGDDDGDEDSAEEKKTGN